MAALSTSTYGTTPDATMADGYDRLEVLIKADTTIDGAIVALCPAEDGTVVADVCIDGPPVS
jgi:aspartyl-tRNA synthetase